MRRIDRILFNRIIIFIITNKSYQKSSKQNITTQMDKHNDSKVQFFNSESSFGSHSNVSGSRLQFFNDQIISDTQAIFSTLNQILIPREDLVQKQKLEQLIHRARILSNQTINQHKNLFPSTVNAPQHRQALHRCDVKLKQLIHDYDRYYKKIDDYRYFYQKYTYNKKNFHKKQSSNAVFVSYQPDVVIIQNSSKNAEKKLKVSNRFQNPQQQSTTSRKDKQFLQLSQQVLQMRRRQSNLIKNQDEQIQNLQNQANQRVKNILILLNNNISQNKKIAIIKNQLESCQRQLQGQQDKKRQINQKLKQLVQKNQILKQQNHRLEKEAQSIRRLSQSRNQNQQDLKRSAHSQYDANNSDNIKKLQKKLRNLKYQNQLLKNQLQKQREQVYRLKKRRNLQQNDQIKILRKKLQQKSQQLKQNKLETDRNQLQIIRLTDQLQKSIRSAQYAKLQATKSQGTQQSFNPVINSRIQDMNKLEQSRNNFKYSVQPYVGDGNQHYPYFQLLSKQFKIRFKRACLKQKQLLYKLNMLQVGIISQFQQPNQIKLLLHLSNFSDHENIRNLSIKVSNAKNNRIVLEKNFFDILEMQQQVKTFVNVFVKLYPIGCTALIIEYQYLGVMQQARIILPAHIFKMLLIKPRDDQFRSSKKLQILGQKKIIKDSQTMMSYFSQASHQGSRIRSTIFHEHTMTKFLLDIENKNGHILFQYEHRMGDENLTDYVVKALAFLFRKQESN